ncbi:hypothetical protein VPH35_058385 [Triticum aestivum]
MQKERDKKSTKGVGEPKKTMDSSGGSVSKKARTTSKGNTNTEHPEKEDDEIFDVFSLEMDTLVCDICFHPEKEACRFAPYLCPFDGCAYRGRLLYSHILDAHAPAGDAATFTKSTTPNTMIVTVTLQKSTPLRALLHPDGKSVFLLLSTAATSSRAARSRWSAYAHTGPRWIRRRSQYT